MAARTSGGPEDPPSAWRSRKIFGIVKVMDFGWGPRGTLPQGSQKVWVGGQAGPPPSPRGLKKKPDPDVPVVRFAQSERGQPEANVPSVRS